MQLKCPLISARSQIAREHEEPNIRSIDQAPIDGGGAVTRLFAHQPRGASAIACVSKSQKRGAWPTVARQFFNALVRISGGVNGVDRCHGCRIREKDTAEYRQTAWLCG